MVARCVRRHDHTNLVSGRYSPSGQYTETSDFQDADGQACTGNWVISSYPFGEEVTEEVWYQVREGNLAREKKLVRQKNLVREKKLVRGRNLRREGKQHCVFLV